MERRGATVVTTADIGRIKGVPASSPVVTGLVRRLKANGWLVPLARKGTYEFVPLRVGAFSSGDELRELEALAQGREAPTFQVALGSAAFLRGYAATAPSTSYVLLSKRASTRPPGLTRRFRVIRTDPDRLFGAEPIHANSRVPVARASRLFLDAALFWQHAGDLRAHDHWLAAAAADVDAKTAARWAIKLGPSVVSRAGNLAERFGARARGRARAAGRAPRYRVFRPSGAGHLQRPLARIRLRRHRSLEVITQKAVKRLANAYKSGGAAALSYLEHAQEHFLKWMETEELFADPLGTGFKGGTRVRKFDLGHEGRFSTDLDFAINDQAVADHVLAAFRKGFEYDGVRFAIEGKATEGNGRDARALARLCPGGAGVGFDDRREA